MSFAFSKACAAFLNGAKLINETIFPNFARSKNESWTFLVLPPMSSVSFASKIA